jgi:hypothetical protein
MARNKYTERFCSYCNRQTKMEIVGAMEGVADKTWYKCTRCRHMTLMSNQNSFTNAVPLDAKTASLYDPHNKYEIGQTIFHSEWNDVGRVLSKARMSNGSNAMTVAFQKLGERQLIENLTVDVPVDPEVSRLGESNLPAGQGERRPSLGDTAL